MRLTGILILIFLLTAFTIGSNIPEDKIAITDSALDNATIEIDMINLDSQTNSTIPNMEGLMDVLERYVKFVGAFFIVNVYSQDPFCEKIVAQGKSTVRQMPELISFYIELQVEDRDYDN
ncbi:hypothetical protein LCGC14_2289640, partial [marine sediment metagenome]